MGVPVPCSCTWWGLPASLSVNVTAAVSMPTMDGVNVVETVQLALAASGPAQVVLLPKSAELVPVSVIDAIVKVAFPMLVSVMTCAPLV